MSFAQERLWFLHQMSPEDFSYNTYLAVLIQGDVDLGCLQHSFDEIANRHEVFRTCFALRDGQPRQIIQPSVTVPFHVIDLDGTPEAERERIARGMAIEEARRPFQLEEAPVIRVTVYRLRPDEHLMIAVIHHIASDRWSMGVLMREVAAHYEGFRKGASTVLPALPIQYTDYAIWQRQLAEEGLLEEQLEFWKEQIGGQIDSLHLPQERTGGVIDRTRGERCCLPISPELTQALADLSQKMGATLFMTLLAAFEAMLYRYSSQESIVIGCPIAVRPHSATHHLIGCFLNTLAFKSDVKNNPTFLELLSRVRMRALRAYSHQDVPFEQIVAHLHPERSLSRTPLFQVMFTLNDLHDPSQGRNMLDITLQSSNLRMKPVELEISAIQCDLALHIERLRNGANARIEFDAALFDMNTIQQMLNNWQNMLQGIVGDPSLRISDLPLMSESQTRELLEWGRGSKTQAHEFSVVHAMVQARSTETPKAIAVSDEKGELTYGELDRRANRLARCLRSMKVGSEVIIGVCLEPSVDLVVALLAILKTGGAYLPLDPGYPRERLAFMLRDSRAALLITRQSLHLDFPGVPALQLDQDAARISAEPDTPVDSVVDQENLAYVIYTSGSTGQPKGVGVAHRGLMNLVNWHVETYKVTGKDRASQIAKLAFDASVWELWPYLAAGASVHFPPAGTLDSHEHLVAWLVRKEITLSFLPTPLAEAVLHQPWPEQGGKLRALLTGGDKLHCGNQNRMTFTLYNHYGPTENSVVATWTEIGADSERNGGAPPIGKPLPNTRAYVLDEHMKMVPAGVSGELCIGGESLARGYLHRPSLSAEKLVPDPFSAMPGERIYRTGDMVRHRRDGQLEFIGRMDQQVKIRGQRIELGEVESVLLQYPGVLQAAVVVSQQPPSQHLAAYVSGQNGNKFTSRELREFLAQQLPQYMLPSIFTFLTELPLTPNGKIDKRALPSVNVPDLSSGYTAPRNLSEELLSEIWAALLKIDRVGTSESFFELGGHSLLATQLMSRVQTVFGVQIPLRRFFDKPTVAGLAEEIDREIRNHQSVKEKIISRREGRGSIPLSFAQQRLWFLNQMEPGSAAYNIPVQIRLRGKLNVEALRRSLNQIVSRHEVLRTHFDTTLDQPCQVVASDLNMDLPLLDLRNPSKKDKANELRRLKEQEGRTPFDLKRGPVFRARLVQVEDLEYLLLFTMHHIASDGWSFGILMRELKSLYTSYSEGRESQLEELPIQYADYSLWQREWLSGEVVDKQLNYWRKQLAVVPLDLPTDFPRPPVQRLEGSHYRFRLAADLTLKLKALGRRQGSTLFMVLLGTFHILLSRYTGQEDTAVGTPIANRTRQEFENLIGFFVNTLVLRVQIEPNDTFLEVLDKVREVTLGAYAYQDVPFEKLVEMLEPERDLSRSPLFQVMMALQNMPRVDAEMPDLHLSMSNIETNTSKFDLSFFVSEEGEGLDVWVEYARHLFRPSTIARLCHNWEELLQCAVDDPKKRAWELTLLGPLEQTLLESSNCTENKCPSSPCVQELVEKQAALTPQAVAVIYGEQQFTYEELNVRANKIAHYLRGLGVAADSLVGICMDRSLDLVTGILAVLKAGAAYVPLDPGYPEDRLRFMLKDAGAKVILTHQLLLGSIPTGDFQSVCLDRDWARIDCQSKDNPVLLTCQDNLAYVMYTSGSTGQPKGVMMCHGALSNLLQWQARHGGRAGRTLQFSPPSFDVSFQEIFSTWMAGKTLVLLSEEQRRNPESLCAIISSHEVERIFVPFVVLHLLAEATIGQRTAPTCLKDVITAGERLQITAPIAELFKTLPAVTLHNHYGPTEAHVVTAFQLPEGREGWTTYPPIGKPISNTQIHVFDQFMQPQPVGVVGEIYIGGEAIGRGYLNRPRLTAERFVPDRYGKPGARLYRTGDLGRYLEDGNLEYVGRKDRQIKILGYRIELGEIESSLMQHPAVQKAVVDVVEDGAEQKRLVAYVVMHPNMENAITDLRPTLLQKLPEYMVPALYVRIAEVPLSPNGKIDREKLKQHASSTNPPQEEVVLPRNNIEEMLSEIWRELLKTSSIGIHQNFFKSGGHSLLATRLASRIRSLWGIELPVRTIFEAPTIAGQARAVQRLMIGNTGSEIPVITPAVRSEELPLSFPQQRLWFLEQMNPSGNSYLIPSMVRVRGKLDSAALKKSLNLLVERHEVLRTTFDVSNGKPVQVIHDYLDVPFQEVSLETSNAADHSWILARLIEKEISSGFDFVAGPLLRACLIRLGPEEHLLVLVLHHIIVDGWSMGILLKEMAALYEAAIKGQQSSLQKLEIQYADYAAWQHRWLKGNEPDRQLGYWKKKLEGAPELLELPTDHPRPAVQSGKGSVWHVECEAGLTTALRQFAEEHHATLFMVLLASFNVLLSRYSGQSDIVVGTPIAGRNRQELEELIGMFVNTLALRSNVRSETCFLELLVQVKATTLEAYAHQDLPFERVVEELAKERGLSHTPIFQVMFALQNVPEMRIEMTELEFQQEPIDSQTAKYDITLAVRETNQSLVADFEYRTDLFEPSTIAQMAQHWENLLRSIIAEPKRRVEELQLLSDQEQQLLLTSYNATAIRWSDTKLPLEVLRRRAEEAPESLALLYRDEVWTYGRLHQETNRLANGLRQLGVRRGSVVGICLERSAGQVVALLAAMKAGAAYIPLDSAHPVERLIYMVEHAQASIVIVDEKTSVPLGPKIKTIRLADIPPGSDENPGDSPWGEDVAYVIYTSGSTGLPKGVMVPHKNLKNLMEWQRANLEICADDRGIYAAGLGFDVTILELWPWLAAGASIAIPDEEVRLDPETLQEWLIQVNATICFVPTPMAEHLIGLDWPESCRLRALLTGGDKLTKRPPSALKFGVWNNYGPTESTVIATSTLVKPSDPSIPSIGLPIANTTGYILDRRLQPVPQGVIGKLYLGGDGLAVGYVRRPAQTAERFIPNPHGEPGKRLYDTGDLVRQRVDGELEFIARADHQVKLRGFRIELGEIESLLKRHEGLQNAAVILWEQANDKRLVAYVEPREGQNPAAEALREYLRAKLPGYMVPSVFMFLQSLPQTPNGKLDRRALPAPLIGPESEREFTAPRDKWETELARIWEQLLQKSPISVRDNFFQTGGHSLLAIELMHNIQKTFERKLPISTLFKSSTIEDLAKVLRSNQELPRPSVLVEIRSGYAKHPFFCVHGAGGQVFPYNELASLLGDDQPFFGLEDQAANSSDSAYRKVKKMAAYYLEAIREIQPEGPYFIGGWSFGGIVAFEMAQEIHRQGAEIGLLALFDTTAPGVRNDCMANREIRDFLARDLELQQTTSQDPALRALLGRAKSDSSVPPSFALPDAQRFLALFAEHVKAAQNYRPRPWKGTIRLFEAKERLSNQVADASVGWTPLCSAVERYVVPGNHYSMLRAPNVQALAQSLKPHLECAAYDKASYSGLLNPEILR